MNLGAQLKKLRKSLKLTQKEFARRIPGRVDHTYMGKIERGFQYPSIKFLERVAETYGVAVGYFFLEGRPAKAASLNVKEDVRRWLFYKVPIFEEELRKKIEESIEKTLGYPRH